MKNHNGTTYLAAQSPGGLLPIGDITHWRFQHGGGMVSLLCPKDMRPQVLDLETGEISVLWPR